MISPAYVRTMAACDTAMNRRLNKAAARLPDADRRAEHGAFWGSRHGTLCHLLWPIGNGWPGSTTGSHRLIS